MRDRRQAEQFAALLDNPTGGPTPGGEFSRMLTLTQALAVVPAPRLDEDAAARMRRRLVAVAAVQPTAPEAATRRTRSRWHSRRLAAVAAGSVSLATALSGVGVAAAGSLPGDPFYAVKRATEAVQLAVHAGDAAKGGFELELAATRLDEARQVGAGRPGATTALLHSMQLDTAGGAADLTRAARSSRSASPLQEFDRFAHDQYSRLLRLPRTAATLPALKAAAQQLVALDHQLQSVAATLPPLPGSTPPASRHPTPSHPPTSQAAPARHSSASGSPHPAPSGATSAPKPGAGGSSTPTQPVILPTTPEPSLSVPPILPSTSLPTVPHTSVKLPPVGPSTITSLLGGL